MPHNDDELFILPFIESQISKGYLIKVFFMTYDNNPVREGESSRTFDKYKEIETFQFGRLYNLMDGNLSKSSDIALKILLENQLIQSSETIVCPTYEGGHVDHDEIFKISCTVALRLQKPLIVFSLYNAYQTPFVRVATLFEGPVIGEREVITFSLYSGFNYFKKSFFYKSQLVILLVLMPGLLKTFLFKRKIEILKVKNFDPTIPHPGKLFYESQLKKKIKTVLGLN